MKRVATTALLWLMLVGVVAPAALAQGDKSASSQQKIKLTSKLWSVYNAKGDAGLTESIDRLDAAQRKQLTGEIVLLQRATDKLYTGKVNPFTNFIYKTRTMIGLPAVDPALSEQPEAPQDKFTTDDNRSGSGGGSGGGGKMTATSSSGGGGSGSGGGGSSLGGSGGGSGGGGGGGGGSGSSGSDSANKSASNKTAPGNTAQIISPGTSNNTGEVTDTTDPVMTDANNTPQTPQTPQTPGDSDTASVPDISPTIDPAAPAPAPITGVTPDGALTVTNPNSIGPGFKVFNALMYQNMPDMAELGIENIKVVYTSAIWPSGTDLSILPPEPHVRATARRMPMDQILVLDIEHWDLTDQHVDWLIQIMQWFREEIPGVKLGFYAMLPERQYWAPVQGGQKLADWQARNRSAPRLRLAQHVDYIFPSLYTFYEDQAGWVTYARANIAEARVYGKPVYAFIWPQYHQSNANVGGQLIPAAYWQKQLLTAGTNADGVVLWGGYRTPWDENTDWWRVTKLMMSTPLAEIIGD